MLNWWCRTTSRYGLALLLTSLGSCQTRDPYEELVEGSISYPFAAKTDPIGLNGPASSDDKFVIRTMAGQTEYSVEIPHAASFYDVEVPIAEMRGGGDALMGGNGLKPTKNPQITDRELVANLPKLSMATREERALLDQAFGMGDAGGPTQPPSYVMGIAKINELYRQGKYELSLIEINNLLSFFPTSSQLYKMKGTVLIKVNNLQLAERSWMRAQELSPNDPVLVKGIERLRHRMAVNASLKASQEIPAH